MYHLLYDIYVYLLVCMISVSIVYLCLLVSDIYVLYLVCIYCIYDLCIDIIYVYQLIISMYHI